MRRLLFLPVFALALACGGGGILGDDESYPRNMTLTVEMRNTSAGEVDMWLEPEVQFGNPMLAAGATRTFTVNSTWDSRSEVNTYRFHAFKTGLLAVANATLGINGREAHAENFTGFIATWDGTTLSVETRE